MQNSFDIYGEPFMYIYIREEKIYERLERKVE